MLTGSVPSGARDRSSVLQPETAAIGTTRFRDDGPRGRCSLTLPGPMLDKTTAETNSPSRVPAGVDGSAPGCRQGGWFRELRVRAVE